MSLPYGSKTKLAPARRIAHLDAQAALQYTAAGAAQLGQLRRKLCPNPKSKYRESLQGVNGQIALQSTVIQT